MTVFGRGGKENFGRGREEIRIRIGRPKEILDGRKYTVGHYWAGREIILGGAEAENTLLGGAEKKVIVSGPKERILGGAERTNIWSRGQKMAREFTGGAEFTNWFGAKRKN